MTEISDDVVERPLDEWNRRVGRSTSLFEDMRAAITEAVKAEREACLAYLRSIHHDATADLLSRARGEE